MSNTRQANQPHAMPAGECAGQLLNRVFERHSLSNADYTVLVALSEAPGGRLRAHELSDALGWEKSRLHHQLTRMCQRGLAERESGASRAMYAVLTPKGRAALEQAAPSHAQEVRRLVIDRLTAEQIDHLAEISNAILDHLHTDHPATGS